jgi:hypothetical protein
MVRTQVWGSNHSPSERLSLTLEQAFVDGWGCASFISSWGSSQPPLGLFAPPICQWWVTVFGYWGSLPIRTQPLVSGAWDNSLS